MIRLEVILQLFIIIIITVIHALEAQRTDTTHVVKALCAVHSVTVLGITVPEGLVLHTGAHQTPRGLVQEDTTRRAPPRHLVAETDLLHHLALTMRGLRLLVEDLGHA